MKHIITFSIAFLLVLSTTWAQRIIIGKVTSDDGGGIAGVNVSLLGRSSIITTDLEGSYRISVPEEGGTLRFFYIGIEIQEIPIGKNSVIDVIIGATPYILESHDYEGEILNMANYSWRNYIQTENGVFYWEKPIKEYSNKGVISMSPLGTELIYASDKNRLSIYNTTDFVEKESYSLPLKNMILNQIIFDELGQQIFAISSTNNLYRLDLSSKKINLEKLSNNFFITHGAWNSNLKTLLIADDRYLFNYDVNKAQVIGPRNMLERILLERVSFDHEITSIIVSAENYEVAIGLSNGEVVIYSQGLNKELHRFKVSNEEILNLTYHPKDQYVFIADAAGKLYSYDRLKSGLISSIEAHSGSFITRAIPDSDNESFLFSAGKDGLFKSWNLSDYAPDYNKIINEKLIALVEKFIKRKDGETAQEYFTRNNEISLNNFKSANRTRLIDSLANIRMTQRTPELYYDGDSLKMKLDPFPVVSMYASEPFQDNQSLQATDLKFDLLPTNEFVISEFMIRSSLVSETLKYKSKLGTLIYEEKEPNIELIRKIANEEYELKNTLQNVVSDLRQKGDLNDVQLSVTSVLKNEKDSLGEDELNLHVTFVSQGIKAAAEKNTSDFPAGKYSLLDSKAATTLVDFFFNSVEDKLIDYLKPETRLSFKIYGSTDKSSIASSIPYDNEYGAFNNFPMYFQDNLSGLNLNVEGGITTNKQLGFLRTYSVKSFIENQTYLFEFTKNRFFHYAEEADGYGPEFRKIKIELIIHSFDKLDQTGTKKKLQRSELSDVDIDIPIRSQNLDAYALIIGNEDYASYQTGLAVESNVPFAIKDAEVFKNYLLNMFQVKEGNVELLLNSTYREMNQAFSRLEKIMEVDGEGKEIIVFYSGHGMPDEENKDPYLIPVDVSGLNVKEGVSLKEIMNRLSDKPHKKLTIITDACFTGAGKKGALAKVRGVTVVPNHPEISEKMVFLASSSGNESSLTDESRKHGLFTYFLLKYLKESSGNISIDALFKDVKKSVALEAIKKFNKSQTPDLIIGKGLLSQKESLQFFMQEQ